MEEKKEYTRDGLQKFFTEHEKIMVVFIKQGILTGANLISIEALA
jgi:hypothetical protein